MLTAMAVSKQMTASETFVETRYNKRKQDRFIKVMVMDTPYHHYHETSCITANHSS